MEVSLKLATSSATRRYSGTSENASRNACGRRVQSAEQSIGVASHLWGLTTIESASSQPSNRSRSSGQTAAEPAYAASTWSQTRASAHLSAIAGAGSIEEELVVPIVATTAQASSRSSNSGRSRKSWSTGTFRTSNSRIRAALSTDECACSEHTTTRSSGRSERATARASIVFVDALSPMWPLNDSGNPNSWRSQSMVTSSSSCSAGDVRQRIPTWLSAADSSSARIPGSDPVLGK